MKLKSVFFKFILFTTVVMLTSTTQAIDQVLDDQEILNIENLYKSTSSSKVDSKSTDLLNPGEGQSVENSNENRNSQIVENKSGQLDLNKENLEIQNQDKIKNLKFEKLTDLNKLSAFREISIIQKKYLPKTERFQLYTGAGTTTNSPWFLNLGVKINLGYRFTESLGVELSGLFLTNSERQVAKEIRENNGLQPEKFVNTKSYLGIDFIWAPIYGKLSLSNKRIIPFDMYFSAGAGNSSTNAQEGSVPTLHVGVGQIFAINKSMAFRWDYSWTTFQATPVADSTLTTGTSSQKNSYNDLILTAGLSFFFPGAKYR